MKSPFPGMDPYLEAHWGDVHARLVTHASEMLQAVLPRDLRARVEERVFVESVVGRQRSVAPDVRVVERPQSMAVTPSGGAGVGMAQPLIIHVDDEPITEGYIEIREAGGERVITVIEFLSLSNKLPGEGQELYLRKQKELKQASVSLVEIDFLRAGQRVLSIPQQSIPIESRTPYQISVRRGWRSAEIEFYGATLRERLPTIPIPLRETDQDVPLELQTLIERCYSGGGYDDVDYTVEADPPLSQDDAAWADQLLRKANLR
jgi:hypothetical protein